MSPTIDKPQLVTFVERAAGEMTPKGSRRQFGPRRQISHSPAGHAWALGREHSRRQFHWMASWRPWRDDRKLGNR